MKLTVVVPTLNRESLWRTLESIKSQPDRPDETIVISDGQYDGLYERWLNYHLPGRFMALLEGPHKDWGSTARNMGITLASGDYIHYIDDDDTYRPGAFTAIRRGIEQGRGPHLFKIVADPSGKTIWKERNLEHMNISTQNLVFPKVPALPRWGSQYWADCHFIRDICAMWPETFWHEEVVVNRNH